MAHVAGRLAVTTADQLASSLGNFVLVFSLARTASPRDFGIYALGIAVLNFALALARSVVATPFTIDSVGSAGATESPQPGTPVSVARSSALSIALGAVLAGAAAPFVLVAAIEVPDLAGALALFLFSLPLLMFQDFLRYVAIARGRPMSALLADGCWTAIVLVLFCYQLWAATPTDAWVCAGVWLLGLGLATVVLVAAGLAERPARRGLAPWLRQDRRHWQLGSDAVLMGGGPIVLLSLVTFLCGSHAVAALRGASTVFGPFNTLMAATTLALVPEVRRRRDARADVLLLGATCLLCLGVVAFGLVMTLVIPDRVGAGLLGDTWPLTERVLLPLTVEYVGTGLMTGGIIWCRAKNRVDVALRLQVTFWTALAVATTTTGIVFGSARAVAIGLAVVGLSMGAASLVRGRRLAYD